MVIFAVFEFRYKLYFLIDSCSYIDKSFHLDMLILNLVISGVFQSFNQIDKLL